MADRSNTTSTFRRLLVFGKVLTIVSVACTLCFAILLFGFQISLWLNEGIWADMSISRVLADLRLQNPGYTTASETPASRGILQWFLDAPVTAFLIVVAGLSGGFLIWLRKLAKQLEIVPEPPPPSMEHFSRH